jgi:hypothetical protein
VIFDLISGSSSRWQRKRCEKVVQVDSTLELQPRLCAHDAGDASVESRRPCGRSCTARNAELMESERRSCVAPSQSSSSSSSSRSSIRSDNSVILVQSSPRQPVVGQTLDTMQVPFDTKSVSPLTRIPSTL